jgi:hypothetical protein
MGLALPFVGMMGGFGLGGTLGTAIGVGSGAMFAADTGGLFGGGNGAASTPPPPAAPPIPGGPKINPNSAAAATAGQAGESSLGSSTAGTDRQTPATAQKTLLGQ